MAARSAPRSRAPRLEGQALEVVGQLELELSGDLQDEKRTRRLFLLLGAAYAVLRVAQPEDRGEIAASHRPEIAEKVPFE